MSRVTVTTASLNRNGSQSVCTNVSALCWYCDEYCNEGWSSPETSTEPPMHTMVNNALESPEMMGPMYMQHGYPYHSYKG
jgi:hypothetical protein